MTGGSKRRVTMLGMGWFPDELGGLTRYYTDLYRALEARSDVDVAGVVTGPVQSPPPGLVVGPDRHSPLPLRLLRLTLAGRRTGSSEVVDGHFALYSLLPFLTWARKRHKVVHFQGPWADEFASVANGSAPVSQRIRRSVERAVYRRADALVVLSREFGDILAERYGVHPGRITVIPPGVDLARFSTGDVAAARVAFGVETAEFVAVSVRRLVPRMGLDRLVRAWADVVAACPTARLLIVGDGPQRVELEQLVATLDLSEHVRLVGPVTDEQLPDVYRAADVAVVPSIGLEGFGLVALEALACGTPVIASDTGGLPDAVEGLHGDLLVPPDDVAALAARLVDAATGRRPLPTRDDCRAHGERFSWDAAVDCHLAIHQRRTDQRRRVVFLDHCARLSGGEIALLRLIEALGDRIDPHVILAEDGPFVDRLRRAGVSVEVMAMDESVRGLPRGAVTAGPALLRSAFGTIRYTGRVARRLRQLRPEVVHLNSLKSGVYGSVAARIAGIPAVWHVRDRIADDYLPAPAVRLVQLLVRALPQMAIANSHATAATLRLPRRRLLVVGDPYAPSGPTVERGSAAAPFTVGIVGRISVWKGHEVFLRAFAAAFADTDARGVIAGTALFEGDGDVEGDLRRLATELGIAERVEFVGFVDDVESLLAGFDVLVHASTIAEPFGQVVLEGMAAGVAVVATDCGGPAELIVDGVDGVLTPPGDVAALADALVRLEADPERRRRIGLAGRERAGDFSPKVIGDIVDRALVDVAGGRSR